MENNPWQESSKKLRVKERRERKKERKKVVKRREKTWQEEGHASIDHLSLTLKKPTLWSTPKVVVSSHLGLFSKMHNFNGKSLWQGCSIWGLGSFLVYLFYEKIQYLISTANIFDFSHYNLYLLYLAMLWIPFRNPFRFVHWNEIFRYWSISSTVSELLLKYIYLYIIII